ncbi:glycosyltransferase [Paenibacillus motobuensis]|uniref:Glycosyltransferase family 1 protein n=1 Tax=Paenibacillus motobuensis TaxID=295324 RepID=A0ABP3HP29_9BACL
MERQGILSKNIIANRQNENISYENGYDRGHNAGYEGGDQEGIARGHPNTLLPIALVITASKDLPSLKMMIYHPFNHLKKLGRYNFRVRTEDTVSREDIEFANIVIFVRNVEPHAYRCFEMAHEMRKRTIYCIDDNFLEIRAGTQINDYYADPARRETFINFLKNAHIVHVNSEFFADYIRLHFNPRVAYFPATVDYEWLDQEVKPSRRDGRIVIGYEGSHKEDDFKPVIPAIKRIFKEYRWAVKIEFFGFIPASLRGYPGVTHFPYEQDYRRFIHRLYTLNWDIGLAPLADTLFNQCKTNNKFREYGACMIPGIYSQMPTYSSWVNHGETGYLVPHTEEGWYEGMKQMIENPALRQKIKEQASSFARSHFSIETCVDNWESQILS